jgi:hypothetical protein
LSFLNTMSIKWWKMQKTKVHWNFYTCQKLDTDTAIISGQAVEPNHSLWQKVKWSSNRSVT